MFLQGASQEGLKARFAVHMFLLAAYAHPFHSHSVEWRKLAGYHAKQKSNRAQKTRYAHSPSMAIIMAPKSAPCIPVVHRMFPLFCNEFLL